MGDISSPESAADAAALVALNLAFADYERRGADGVAFFDAYLDEQFLFRRAAGQQRVVGKEAFLAGLRDPGNTNEILSATVVQAQVLGDQGFAEVHVRLKGRRGGASVDGTFRNLRMFERHGDGWHCVMWFNRPISPSSSSATSEAVAPT